MIARRLLAAVLAAAFLLPSVASASWPWYGPIAGGYGGYDNGYVYPFFYRVRSIPTPPYFSLHPPVYYGPRILYRPYGNSPFAYPSWYERQFSNVTSPYEPANVQPLMIVNPYVGQQDGAEQQTSAATSNADAQATRNPHIAAR
jgi:hypothetical protein